MANKRYDQFSTVAPTTSRITLTGDPSTGALGKCTIQDIINLVATQYTFLDAIQAQGSPIKASNYGVSPMLTASSSLLQHAWMFVSIIPCPAFTATGIWYSMAQAGVFTAGAYNGFGLYSISAGTCTLIASTPHDANIFKTTAHTFQQKAFNSQVSLTAGTYFTAVLFTGSSITTTPALEALNVNVNTYNLRLGMTNTTWCFGVYAGTGSFPTPFNMSALSTPSVGPMMYGLY